MVLQPLVKDVKNLLANDERSPYRSDLYCNDAPMREKTQLQISVEYLLSCRSHYVSVQVSPANRAASDNGGAAPAQTARHTLPPNCYTEMLGLNSRTLPLLEQHHAFKKITCFIRILNE